jgi:FHA domain
VRPAITEDDLRRLGHRARLSNVALPGASRLQLEQRLNAAYASGLLSEHTLAQRIDLLFASRLIDPAHLVGDLGNRDRRGRAVAVRLRAAAHLIVGRVLGRMRPEPLLLGLDWEGGGRELSVGRHHSCDIRFTNPRVSRRHARLVFRDGVWIVHDLASTNGTLVNGVTVGRCRIRPGDELAFGGERVRVD